MAACLAKVSGLYDCVTLALSWGVGGDLSTSKYLAALLKA